MKNNQLTVHMMVKNEDRFIWYSISSVLPYADRIFIADTGSTDNTIKIIKSFNSKKIEFYEREVRDVIDIARIREEQVDKTTTDWFWVVDGDEIYPSFLCEEIKNVITTKGETLEGIVVGRYDLLGDIYHFQNPDVGPYHLFGKKGHIVVRLINKKNINGIRVSGSYPYEGYYDKSGREIIHHSPHLFYFTTGKLWHAMYLKRSSSGANIQTTFHRNKYKIEWGRSFPDTVKIPDIFNQKHPTFVSDVHTKRSTVYTIESAILTPVKMVKRMIF
ncbi:hypothetical protein A3D77_02445 [Candidatus Gottesmanbacteria bacterium RIFCSPHIGHO2_02_FULL_39_11]|uniref:Glycosyltransferase 2-like domain-containing protein n=1 Tax=Candidatus Gottesmanbacteria bacterium RIFCSPHIGHO2_02_FULL_39_11 TaxID=1798382 RepID=A0A1F5ZVE3_9BACT|nr:MAG: hypothetical protein A3D77_02445 [Candidatus Gottesmanbacteria bacterium RIFCSPHIGHO2_02_FULL_39_11]